MQARQTRSREQAQRLAGRQLKEEAVSVKAVREKGLLVQKENVAAARGRDRLDLADNGNGSRTVLPALCAFERSGITRAM